MGFHRHGSEALTWPFEEGGGVAAVGDDTFPQRLLLAGVEEEAAVGGVRVPSCADELLPVENLRGGPGGQALSAARAMELGCDGSGGAVTGGDDHAAVA